MTQQIISQTVVSLALAFIGHYFGQNILVAVGFGMIAGLIVRNSK